MSEVSSRPRGFRFDALFAVLMLDDKGEGIPRVRGPDGEQHLLVDANPDLVRQFVPILEMMGKPYRVVRFDRAADVTEQMKRGHFD